MTKPLTADQSNKWHKHRDGSWHRHIKDATKQPSFEYKGVQLAIPYTQLNSRVK